MSESVSTVTINPPATDHQEYRVILLAQRDEIANRHRKPFRTDLAKGGDLADVALEEVRHQMPIRHRERDFRLLAKIDLALDRITLGTYGICQECGSMIDPRRLRARPTAVLCIQCKEEQEQQERQNGLGRHRQRD